MKARFLVLAIVVGLMSGPALGGSVDLVTFAYTGIVTSLIDTNGALDSSIFIGQSFSGSYTFDPTTPDITLSDEQGNYQWLNPSLRGFTADFFIGNYAFGLSPSFPSGAVGVKDNAPFGPINQLEDLYQANGQLVQTSGPFFPLPGGNPQGIWTIVLQNTTDLSVITSDALPIVPPDINLFEMNRFSFQNNTAEIDIRGFLTSLNPAPVPEPATLSLLGIGLLAGAALRKRFK